MGFLPDHDKEHLRKLFGEKLKDEVRILVFTQETECEFCKETRGIVEEVATTSDKIKVEVYDFVKDEEKVKEYQIKRIPAIAIIGKKDYGIRFYGVPSGYEFVSLVDDIVDVSSGTTNLSEDTKNRLKSVNEPVHIQVFVLPTCPYCPKAIRLAHQFAIENDLIKADMVEATEFPQLAQKYNVMSVPKTIINETVDFVGALPEEQFVEHVLLGMRKPPSTMYS